MGAYYNEHDAHAAAWLRELIQDGLIAAGDVDERDIQKVQPDDLKGYRQVHLFAGIGGWSHALRLAGWEDDRPVWTCSCPCQPWSVGDTREEGEKGFTDERHLWPDAFRLARECRPDPLFGEQVRNAIPLGWLDRVFEDLESEGYACGAVVLPAYAVEAEHERERIYWVADTCRERRKGYQSLGSLFGTEKTPLAVNGDTLVRARRALAGDYGGLLHSDGLSVAMERRAAKGYGNAIVPPLAAEFIRAYRDVTVAA